MPMPYEEEEVAIGNVFNAAIQETLSQFGIENPELLGALARNILVMLDQSGHQIVRK